MNDITFLLVKVVAAVAMTLITGFLIPVLRSYVQNNKEQQLYNLVETAVRAAEQTIKESGMGAVKKEQVVGCVTQWLFDRGISIRADQLDQLIEEAVYLMKNPIA